MTDDDSDTTTTIGNLANSVNTAEEYSAKIIKLQQAYLTPLKEDLADWLNKILNVDNVTAENFMSKLDNGVIVCKLAKIISIWCNEHAATGTSTPAVTLLSSPSSVAANHESMTTLSAHIVSPASSSSAYSSTTTCSSSTNSPQRHDIITKNNLTATNNTTTTTNTTPFTLSSQQDQQQHSSTPKRSNGNLSASKCANTHIITTTKPVVAPMQAKIWEDAKCRTFYARDNVCNFIRWTKELGVNQSVIFETDDLVLHGNARQVVLCLLDVARIACVRYGFVEAPGLVKFEQEIDMELAFEMASTAHLSADDDCGIDMQRPVSMSSIGHHDHADQQNHGQPMTANQLISSWHERSNNSENPQSFDCVDDYGNDCDKQLDAPCDDEPQAVSPIERSSSNQTSSGVTPVPSDEVCSTTDQCSASFTKKCDNITTDSGKTTSVNHEHHRKSNIPTPVRGTSNVHLLASSTLAACRPTPTKSDHRHQSPSYRSSSNVPADSSTASTTEEDDDALSTSDDVSTCATPSTAPTGTGSDLDGRVMRIAKSYYGKQVRRGVQRLSEGKYKIADRIVFVRLLKGQHVMVRIGGGWDTLQNFLFRHKSDPSQVIDVDDLLPIDAKLVSSPSTPRDVQSSDPQSSISSNNSNRKMTSSPANQHRVANSTSPVGGAASTNNASLDTHTTYYRVHDIESASNSVDSWAPNHVRSNYTPAQSRNNYLNSHFNSHNQHQLPGALSPMQQTSRPRDLEESRGTENSSFGSSLNSSGAALTIADDTIADIGLSIQPRGADNDDNQKSEPLTTTANSSTYNGVVTSQSTSSTSSSSSGFNSGSSSSHVQNMTQHSDDDQNLNHDVKKQQQDLIKTQSQHKANRTNERTKPTRSRRSNSLSADELGTDVESTSTDDTSSSAAIGHHLYINDTDRVNGARFSPSKTRGVIPPDSHESGSQALIAKVKVSYGGRNAAAPRTTPTRRQSQAAPAPHNLTAAGASRMTYLRTRSTSTSGPLGAGTSSLWSLTTSSRVGAAGSRQVSSASAASSNAYNLRHGRSQQQMMYASSSALNQNNLAKSTLSLGGASAASGGGAATGGPTLVNKITPKSSRYPNYLRSSQHITSRGSTSSIVGPLTAPLSQ